MITRNFVAVDFETATADRMICEVGIAVVEDGKIVEKFQSVVMPPDGRYDIQTLAHNHIRPLDWANAPTFDQLWPRISKYFIGRTLVSHNSEFDKGALTQTMSHYGLPQIKDLENNFYCTEKYCEKGRLGAGCEYFGIPFDEKLHHGAEYDAEKCAEIAMHLFAGEEMDIPRMEAIAEDYRNRFPKHSVWKRRTTGASSSTSEGTTHKIKTQSIDVPIRLPARVDPASEENPFRDKKIVFTGDFTQNRKTLEKFIKNVMGGVITSTVSKNTNFFFIGENPGSTKMGAYEKLKHNGFNVPVFYQHDIDEILSGVWAPYQNTSAVKKLDFTYEHYTMHHISFKNGRNVLASREVYTGKGLNGNSIYFDVVLGNLGALDSYCIDMDTNICILSDQTLKHLQEGVKDETILNIEKFYNENRSIVFDFSFLSESEVVNFCRERCEKCGDELTMSFLNKFLSGGVMK